MDLQKKTSICNINTYSGLSKLGESPIHFDIFVLLL